MKRFNRKWQRSTLAIGSTAAAAMLVAGPALAGDRNLGQGQVQHAGAFLPDQIGGYASTHILVKVRPGVDVAYTDGGLLSLSPEVDAELAQWNVLSARPAMLHTPKFIDVAREVGLDRWHRVEVPRGTDTLAMADALSQFEDLIEVAEVDLIGGVTLIPNDTHFGLEYGLHNTGQSINGRTGTPDADIDAPEAWDVWTGDGSITLAVIDSGVNPHPDYTPRMVPGWNTYNNGPDTSDACPHGTHVAGIAGATGNDGYGVAGVSWGVKIMPIRVLLGCSGQSSQCADGITWSTDNGANIGTMSLQYGYTFSQYFEDSTTYAHANNVLLVAAAANFNGPITYPAKFPLVMAVAATDNRDLKASFSCFGPEMDCAAPGVDVYNTWVGNSWTYLSGTSMATPHVSGLASLIWSADPGMSNDEVRDIINRTADDRGAPGWDEIFGFGRINAFRAINEVSRDVDWVYPNGLPGSVDPRGGTTVRVEVVPVDSTPVADSGVLYYNDGGAWDSVSMVYLGNNTYDAVFPAVDCGVDVSFYFGVDLQGGGMVTDPSAAPDRAYSALGAVSMVAVVDDNFENDFGWSTYHNRVFAGFWDRAVPNSGSANGAPVEDFDGSGNAWVTGNGLNEDLDGGPEELISPMFSLENGDAIVSFAYWYYDSRGDEAFEVQVSNNNGQSWTTAFSTTESDREWVETSFRVSDVIAPTRMMKLRFIANDAANNSTCEVAVDALKVDMINCGTEMVHSVSNFAAGRNATFSVEQATANETVYFVYSTAGSGTTNVNALGVVLSIKSPTLIGSTQADGSGFASLTRPVPGSAQGALVWLQAAQTGRVSNVVATQVQ